MEKKELLSKMAPCGLVCHTCAAADNGVIKNHGQMLLRLLDAFDSFAEEFAAHEPRLKKYPEFKEVLLFFTEGSCKGCREGECKYPGCPVWPCIKEKGHDFCFECDAFPCDEVDSLPLLKKKWMRANMRMREIGAEAYFNEVKHESHYA